MGAVPLRTEPASVTLTATVSGAAVAPLRVSVNTASPPSVTGAAAAAIDTSISADDGPRGRIGPGRNSGCGPSRTATRLATSDHSPWAA